MNPFQNKTVVLEIWCYQSVEWKKFFEIIRNGHGIFSQLARLWRPWCFYFMRLGGFSKAEGGLWNLKFLMHLWSFYKCRFEIIFGLVKYFKLTFKHKPCFHAKTNFGDISAPKNIQDSYSFQFAVITFCDHPQPSFKFISFPAGPSEWYIWDCLAHGLLLPGHIFLSPRNYFWRCSKHHPTYQGLETHD